MAKVGKAKAWKITRKKGKDKRGYVRGKLETENQINDKRGNIRWKGRNK